MRLTDRPKLTRVISAAATLAAVASLGLLTAPSANAVPDTECEYPSVSVFPGSGFAPYVRYGEVELSFEICGSDPTKWKGTITKDDTNATGDNLGFFMDSTSLKPEVDGQDKRDYHLTINAQSCVPRVGWPCYWTYSIEADVHVNGDGEVTIDGKDAPLGVGLYDTP